MNKKAGIIDLIAGIILILLFVVAIYFSYQTFQDYKELKQYQDFCGERPNFCYCDLLSCEYKTRWSSVDGFSEDTKALCKLAEKLNDTETIFKVGCLEK